MYFYTDAKADVATFGVKYKKPTVSMTMHLVGTVIPNDDVLLDQVDRVPELVIFTPALTKLMVNNAVHYNNYGLQLDGGARDISVVEREIIAALPPGTTYSFHVDFDPCRRSQSVAWSPNRSHSECSVSSPVWPH